MSATTSAWMRTLRPRSASMRSARRMTMWMPSGAAMPSQTHAGQK